MTNKFPKFKDVSHINCLKLINEEILLAQKALFELKIILVNSKEKTTQRRKDLSVGSNKKSHCIIFFKRRLAHLKYQQSLLLKNELKNR